MLLDATIGSDRVFSRYCIADAQVTQIPSARAAAFPLAWYDDLAPDVSIIILNYNKPDLTRACLEHLWAYTSGYRYEIIVVDNGSAPENVTPLRSISGPFKLLPLQINRFFGEGNNIGVEAARGTYVLFLNNDAFVTEGWLAPLVKRLEEEPLVAGVGPRFLYPDGRTQEAGAFMRADGEAIQVGKFGSYSPDDIESDHIVDYVSAACFLMRRDVFLLVGGFEYVYEPAYYEDVDLCLKIAARGLFIGYCANSRVIHIENGTSADTREALGLDSVMGVNRAQFLKFWGNHLAMREEKALEDRQILRPSGTRPRAVFYTPYDITPGGGERYLLTAAAALLPEFDVYLATEETYSFSRIDAIGRNLSLNLQGINLTERRNLGRLGAIDLSIIISNESSPPFAGFALKNLYICQFPFPIDWAETMRRRCNIEKFQETIVYSDFVKENLVSQFELTGVVDHPVRVVPPPVPVPPMRRDPAPLTSPVRIVLIGRFFAGGHNKRHDVAIEAVRLLVASGLSVELDLVGGLSPRPDHRKYFSHLLSLAEGLPVTFHPNAAPDVLDSILSRGHIYIHATGYGVDKDVNPHECEHFGISVLEAMSYGLAAFVVNNGGPVGFIEDQINGFVYSSVEELVSKIQKALSTPGHLDVVRRAALATPKLYDEEVFISTWRELALSLL